MDHDCAGSDVRGEVLAALSHELRTPLAAIQAFVELLIDGEARDEATRREFYEVIRGEAGRLGQSIDNVLNLSCIESGLARAHKRPQDLSDILRDAALVIEPQARRKRIDLRTDLPAGGCRTLADRQMLGQAVANLLSNAVKFTPAGGSVTVGAAVDADRRTVVAKITDTGVGIPPKDLPYVFDKFFRADANRRVAPGSGLGLSFVKHVIETVHHGKVAIESRVGRGSCVEFKLELAPDGRS